MEKVFLILSFLLLFLMVSCATTIYQCADGSSVQDIADCPVIEEEEEISPPLTPPPIQKVFVCWDGSEVNDKADCPIQEVEEVEEPIEELLSGDSFEITFNSADVVEGTKLKNIEINVRNLGDSIEDSYYCDYELYNADDESRKAGRLIIVGSSSTTSSTLRTNMNRVVDLDFSRYDMYTEPPYTLIADCDETEYRVSIDPLPTCTDGIKNGQEEDIDCGLYCGVCQYSKGFTVEVDKVEFKVTDVETQFEIGKDYSFGFSGAEANGEYYVVSLNMKNIDTKQRSIDPNDFVIVDSDGNRYSSDSNAAYYYEEYHNGIRFDYSESLNPQQETRGEIIFDVPKKIENLVLEVYSYYDGNVKQIRIN